MGGRPNPRYGPAPVAALALVLAGAPGAALAGPLASPQSDPQVEALTAAVRALEDRVAAEAAARQALEARLAAAEAVERLPAAAEADGGAAEPRAAPGIKVTFGGFLAAEAVYRSRNEASDISSSFNRIPFDNAPQAHQHELRGTARQTRLSVLLQGSAGPAVRFAGYGEIDFQGAAQTANSIESNSYNPRLRHLYATLGWDNLGLEVLAGQTWSLATLNGKGISPRNELPPPLIDGQYIPGFVWARQPQLRLTKTWSNGLWAAVSLENPQTTFASPATGILGVAPGVEVLTSIPGVSGFDNGNSLSLNNLPDVVGKIAYEPRIGGRRPLHLEVFGLRRSYGARVDVKPGNALGLAPGAFTVDADGGGVGGSVTATLAPLRLDLQASALTGRGIGRYGSAQLPDATLRPDGSIEPVGQTMFLVGAVWHPSPRLDLYVFGGQERQTARFFDDSTGHYGLGNPAATFTEDSCTTEGGVCAPNLRQVRQVSVGAWHKPYVGAFGQVRLGLEYSHTWVSGFPAGDFAPRTSEDMVFASFRYYPPVLD